MRFFSWVLFLAVSATGFFLVPSIGPAWDEPDNIFVGGVYWNFVGSGFNPNFFDTSINTSSAFGDRVYPLDRNLAHLPPVHNYLGTFFVAAGQAAGVTPTGEQIIIAYHWATSVFFALLVTTVYRFGLLLGLSFPLSLFAALATFLYPTLFGHGLSNSKDIAQASLFTISLYYLAAGRLKNKPRQYITGAIFWGLALATKFNAIYVPIIWFIWMLFFSKRKLLLTVYCLLLREI